MKLPPDYHTHCYLCRHATGRPVEYAAAAIQNGNAEIGFSDHAPLQTDGYDEWRMLASELPQYLEMIEEARKRFPDFPIRAGMEVDFIPGHEDWIRELAHRYPWDYFIGSVHYLDNKWDIDNPEKKYLWLQADVNDVWHQYFERLTRAAESGLFNILGHCDLPKKFNFRPTCDCSALHRTFLKAAAKTGTAIEINTSGWEKECHEAYPSLDILTIAHTEGVALSFGSDSHASSEVGRHFAKAITLAKQAGYTHSIYINQRKIETRPLP